MKGYIPVEIPTRKYIRAFVIAQLGPKPLICTKDHIGSKLYDVLQHSTNDRKSQFASKHYDATIRVYISLHKFRQKGTNFNETNVKNFNGVYYNVWRNTIPIAFYVSRLNHLAGFRIYHYRIKIQS